MGSQPAAQDIVDDETLLSLFEALAERNVSDENKLSDMTYAMFIACPEFRAEFIRFFGFPFKDYDRCNIEREYPLGDGTRVDWAIYQDPHEIYLIENKINDRNYHFADYSQSPVGRGAKGFGLIAAHTVLDKAPSKWAVRTWSDFAEFLDSKSFGTSENLVVGYIEYLKVVCSMAQIKHMQFSESSLQSLYYFSNLIEKIISSYQNSKAKCALYRTRYDFANECAGKYFSIITTKPKMAVYPWFGIQFDESPSIIGIWFDRDKGWGAPIFTNKAFHRHEGKYYTSQYYRDGIWFELKEAYHKKFTSSSLDEQKKTLGGFFTEVVGDVVNSLVTEDEGEN